MSASKATTSPKGLSTARWRAIAVISRGTVAPISWVNLSTIRQGGLAHRLLAWNLPFAAILQAQVGSFPYVNIWKMNSSEHQFARELLGPHLPYYPGDAPLANN